LRKPVGGANARQSRESSSFWKKTNLKKRLNNLEAPDTTQKPDGPVAIKTQRFQPGKRSRTHGLKTTEALVFWLGGWFEKKNKLSKTGSKKRNDRGGSGKDERKVGSIRDLVRETDSRTVTKGK